MKRIKNLEFLIGKGETMTMMEFRSAPGDAISKAEMGMTITLTRKGHAIAKIVPIEGDALELGAALREIPDNRDGTY